MTKKPRIDTELPDQSVIVCGGGSGKPVIAKRSREFIVRRQQKRLLEIVGKLEWDETFDYKAARSRHPICSS